MSRWRLKFYFMIKEEKNLDLWGTLPLTKCQYKFYSWTGYNCDEFAVIA